MKNSVLALTALAMLSACVSQKSYNFRDVAMNPHALKGSHARITTTDNQVIEMDVEDVQGNHLYGNGKYVPISVIKSAKTSKRGMPDTSNVSSPVNPDEIPTFLTAAVIWTFPVLIVLGVTQF